MYNKIHMQDTSLTPRSHMAVLSSRPQNRKPENTLHRSNCLGLPGGEGHSDTGWPCRNHFYAAQGILQVLGESKWRLRLQLLSYRLLKPITCGQTQAASKREKDTPQEHGGQPEGVWNAGVQWTGESKSRDGGVWPYGGHTPFLWLIKSEGMEM